MARSVRLSSASRGANRQSQRQSVLYYSSPGNSFQQEFGPQNDSPIHHHPPKMTTRYRSVPGGYTVIPPNSPNTSESPMRHSLSGHNIPSPTIGPLFMSSSLQRSHATTKSTRHISARHHSASLRGTALSAVAATRFPVLLMHNDCPASPTFSSSRVSCVTDPPAEPFEYDFLLPIDTRTEISDSVMVCAPCLTPRLPNRDPLPIRVSTWSASVASPPPTQVTHHNSKVSQNDSLGCTSPKPQISRPQSQPTRSSPSPSHSSYPTHLGWDFIKRSSRGSSIHSRRSPLPSPSTLSPFS